MCFDRPRAGGLTDRTNMVIRFPDNATPEQRAALIAGMMLIEYTEMEFRRQSEKNNRNSQGGGYGGAPAQQEMSR